MDFSGIIEKHYAQHPEAYRVLISHSRAVAEKALLIAKKAEHFSPDLKFIEEAAMLHDIGIFLTDAKDIGCFGEKPYICHGVLGRKILEKEGFQKHGLVCERHIGVGITAEEVKSKNLPLPLKNMSPLSVEEEIICLADKFFNKSSNNAFQEKTAGQIRKSLLKHGKSKVEKFNLLLEKYGIK